MPVIELDQVNSPFVIPDPGAVHPWDEITVASQKWGASVQTPLGRKFEIKGAKRAYKWQIRDGMGLQGSPQVYWGWLAPHTFTITFYMFTQDEYAQWVDFQSLFMYDATPGKFPRQPTAVSIYHPMLSILGITGVLTEDVGAVEKQSDDKVYTVVVTLREFRNPIPIIPNVPDTASTVDPSNPNLTPRQLADKAKLDAAIRRNAIANGKGRTPKLGGF